MEAQMLAFLANGSLWAWGQGQLDNRSPTARRP